MRQSGDESGSVRGWIEGFVCEVEEELRAQRGEYLPGPPLGAESAGKDEKSLPGAPLAHLTLPTLTLHMLTGKGEGDAGSEVCEG